MEHTAFFVKTLLVRALPSDLQESVSADLGPVRLFDIPQTFRQSKARNHETSSDTPMQVAYASNSQPDSHQQAPSSQRPTFHQQHNTHNKTHNHYNTRSPSSQRTSHAYTSQPRKRYGATFTPTRDMCYACLRNGHIAPHCPHPRRCPFHGETPILGHSFAACKKYPHLAREAMDTIRKLFNSPKGQPRQQNRSVFFQSAVETNETNDLNSWELELERLCLQ